MLELKTEKWQGDKGCGKAVAKQALDLNFRKSPHEYNTNRADLKAAKNILLLQNFSYVRLIDWLLYEILILLYKCRYKSKQFFF